MPPRKAVENPDFVPLGEQLISEVRTDKAGATGDQNMLRHFFCPLEFGILPNS